MTTLSKKLQALLNPLSIPLIINDDIELARDIGAEGVHLGQKDGDPIHARQLLGEGKIIGQSIESWQELEHANRCSVLDYVAASAVFESKHKSNLKTLWGIEGLKTFCSLSRHSVIAIGGIHAGNVAAVKAAGAAGIAVIGAFHESENPTSMAQDLSAVLKEKRNG